MGWTDPRCLFLVPMLALSLSLAAQAGTAPAPAPPAATPKASTPTAPALRPGEGLAIAGPDLEVHAYGAAAQEQPMGDLAQIAWLRLEGEEWAARDVQFKCTGTMGAFHCLLPKGHGRLNLKKAIQESCQLAFLGWILDSAQYWRHEYGEGAARARLVDVFAPFLGRRLKAGENLPEFGLEWVGAGDLLRSSPEALLKWLLDPAQSELLYRCRRLMLDFLTETYQTEAWWIKTGTAPVPGEAGATSAWALGSNDAYTVVLHLPKGTGKTEALARFQAIMAIPVKAKKK